MSRPSVTSALQTYTEAQRRDILSTSPGPRLLQLLTIFCNTIAIFATMAKMQ